MMALVLEARVSWGNKVAPFFVVRPSLMGWGVYCAVQHFARALNSSCILMLLSEETTLEIMVYANFL